MKISILFLYFGTAVAYDEKKYPKSLFEPAQTYRRMSPFQSEGIDPLRTNQGAFFQPATALPWPNSGYDQIHEQVLNSQREKRDAAGALHIVTNHAQPIHADIKPDGSTADLTEKPCPSSKHSPSHVENGVVFQVTAPEDTFYELKSLRKSWPLPSKLELVRSISRVVTLAVLVISAVVEFFPLLRSLYYTVYGFIYV